MAQRPLPAPQGAAYWFGWDIARGVSMVNTRGLGTIDVVLDGWGGLHGFSIGGQPSSFQRPQDGPYWSGWDIARDVALLPDGSGGYVLDGWGGLHPFTLSGPAPPTTAGGGYWPGWDTARAVMILPDGTGGYVIDAWGGAHPFAIGTGNPPAPLTSFTYIRGIDFVRGAVVVNTFGGLMIDDRGDFFRLARDGTVPPANPIDGPRWPWPIAQGVAVDQ